MSGIKWNKEEDQFVIDNYKKITAEEIGKKLNRTTQSIYIRSFKLQLRQAQKPITIGQKFGDLIVTKISERKTKHNQSYIFCKCICGIEKEFLSSNLNRGYTNSCGCTSRQRHGLVSYNSIYAAYRRGAKDRNLVFDLDMQTFIKLTSQNCNYCNAPPKPYNHYLRMKTNTIRAQLETFEEAWIQVNGIDRVDNTKGYQLDNCVACCSQCNSSKMDGNVEEFKLWIQKAYKHLFT